MKRFSENGPLDGLIKTLALLVAAHVVVLALGYFIGDSGETLFDIPLIWPHFRSGIFGWIISVGGFLLIWMGFSRSRTVEA